MDQFKESDLDKEYWHNLDSFIEKKIFLPKYIGTLAVAYHKIDFVAARKKQIPVTNIAGYYSDSVAGYGERSLLSLVWAL